MEAKKTRGRQKIEMKRIANKDDRLITFSKRRSGIYKKASELITLTGAKVAFVVFSPAGKPFSFSHPSVDTISRHFLGEEQPPNDCTHPIVDAHRQVRINNLNTQYNDLVRQLDVESEMTKELKLKIKGKNVKGWWETPIDRLNMEELLEVEKAYKELHTKLCNKIQERSGIVSTSSHPPDDKIIETSCPFAAPDGTTLNGTLFQ